MPVDSAVTSVSVLVHLSQEAASGVVRPISSTTNKAEVTSTVSLETVPLSGVAAVESGIPNIVLEQPAIDTIIENDLRVAINEGLDELVTETFADSGFQAPGSDEALVSYRKAITQLYEDGFSPDVIILTPEADEALDVLVTGLTDGDNDYVFGPAQFGPRSIFGMRRHVSKAIPAPVVLDSRAYGKLYASPARLATFEENAGKTNTSLVRLELTAAPGVERQDAAIRIAAS